MSVNAKMTAIADEIRAKTGGTEPLTLDDMAENVPKVYEAGKQSEYDAFWDAYLPNDNGNMTSVFAGNTWYRPVGGVVAFKPNKDIKPVNATNMFYLWNNGHKVNLKEYLDGLGVKLDFSNCTDMTNCFSTNTTITALGVIDARKATRMNNCFYWMTYLESIEEFMPPTDKTAWTNQVFQNCDRLQHIVVNGEFVTNGWNFQWSTLLSHDSIVSIINALSATTTGLTVTLSKTAVENAFAEKENLFDFQSLTGIVGENGDSMPSYGVIDKVNEIYTSKIGVYSQSSYLYPPLTLPAGEYTLSTQVYLDHEKATNMRLCIKGSEGIISSKYNDIPDKEWTDESISFVLNEPTEIYIGLQSVGGAANYRDLDVQFKDIKIERNEWAELVASKPNWTISLV